MNIIRRITAGLESGHAAVITSDVNRFYATGFSSSAGTLFITKKRAYFFTDARYYEKAVDAVSGCEVILQDDWAEQAANIFISHGIKLVSIENKTMTVRGLTRYIERFPDIEFDSSSWLSDIIEKQRIIKTEEELRNIETAQRITERAFTRILDKLEPGLTERQIATLLTYYILELGADDIAFPIIAASGKNSAAPHAHPTNKQVEDGDFLILDFGAVYNGYRSDMTRTVGIGSVSDEMRRVYNAVLGAHGDALKALRPDISGKLADNVARSTLEAWGYDKYFGHGLGHGVGLEVHEAPTLSQKSDSTLREGMVVTVEPGVYIPGSFGVRIEDMAYITAEGCINLTKTPKALICK